MYSTAADNGSVHAWRNLAAMHAAGEGSHDGEESGRRIAKYIVEVVIPKLESDNS